MNKKIIVIIALGILMSLVISCTPTKQQTPNEIFTDWDADIVNINVPNLTLPTLNGEQVSVKNFFKDKVGFIGVWRSTCPHCQYDMPKLMKVIPSIKTNNFTFLHVSSDTEKTGAIDFVKAMNISSPVAWDPKANQIRDTNIKITGTPTLFVINSNSKIVARIVGSREWDSAKIKKQIQMLVEQL